ncbi:hypothetical protein MKY25_15680 [Geobacillus sp. FSL W8-0032]|uniref:Uncharacterized protein n=2 Tax=Anoxybacillaceae TaxID=3120669 RepID=A0A1I0U098_9BACL|nr:MULTISPECIES: hypothetical protein [Bacillaceae]KYD24797.1 hypothetical protein B4113_2129 [Geobacillus sp. B4113_201601]MEB3751180.1 hypothetical protein [Geobacillus icigianus]SFA57340.1 hypothetical protein SAMN05192569_10932 [Parageobacillus thermantarcticus]
MSYLNYDYKKKKKKNGNQIVSIRDIGENSLLEVELKDNEVQLVVYWRNDKTVGFKMPKEMFENIYKDLMESN